MPDPTCYHEQAPTGEFKKVLATTANCHAGVSCRSCDFARPYDRTIRVTAGDALYSQLSTTAISRCPRRSGV